MTDITDRIIAKTDLKKLPPEFYDGQWDLHPSADVFLSLEDELTDLHSTEINLDWATKRIGHESHRIT